MSKRQIKEAGRIIKRERLTNNNVSSFSEVARCIVIMFTIAIYRTLDILNSTIKYHNVNIRNPKIDKA